ncbi:hypothetical protein EDD86DRAFT_199387 [Gorgonomyces haynaldii]|nr:hypothetical protein EDD86DRAFT_199387 [Gorgonomyces haynaldii]
MSQENKLVWVKYQRNAIGIDLGFYVRPTGEWRQTISNVTQLITAYKAAVHPRFKEVPDDDLSLYTPGSETPLARSIAAETLDSSEGRPLIIRASPAVQQPAPAQQPQPMDIDEKAGANGTRLDAAEQATNQLRIDPAASGTTNPATHGVQSVRYDSDKMVVLTYKDALDSYFEKASLIWKNHQQTKKLEAIYKKVRELSNGSDSSDVPKPFAFLEASSGLGKTQTALSVAQKLIEFDKIPVDYLVMAKVGDAPQRVYDSFADLSAVFMNCLNADYTNLVGSSKGEVRFSPSVPFLRTSQTRMFGFIGQLLEQVQEGSLNALVQQAQGKRVNGLVQQDSKRLKFEAKSIFFADVKQLLKGKSRLFIIDECIANEPEKFRLLRNIFRCLDVGLLILGTDSRVKNLEASLGESSRGSSDLWTHVFTDLPKTLLDYYPPDVAITVPNDSLLDYLLTHSRPVFADFYMSAVQQNPNQQGFGVPMGFDGLLQELFRKMMAQKPIFKQAFGRAGQLRLFHNAFHPINQERYHNSMTHHHFAILPFEGEDRNFALNSDMTFQKTPKGYHRGQEWSLTTVFPKVKDDILLYLTLMGGKGFHAFYQNSSPVTYLTFLKGIKEDNKSLAVDGESQNIHQISNNGMDLEVHATALLCYSSHLNGLSGISLPRFLAHLCRQLSFGGPEMIAEIPMHDVHQQIIIPYLSPPNTEWPTDLPRAGLNLAGIHRTKNINQLDALACRGPFDNDVKDMKDVKEVVFTVECKDHTTALDAETSRMVMDKVPEKSPLHFVFCRNVSHLEGLEEYLQHSDMADYDFFRLDVKNSKMHTFQSLPGSIPPAEVITRSGRTSQRPASNTGHPAQQKLIIFVEVGDVLGQVTNPFTKYIISKDDQWQSAN